MIKKITNFDDLLRPINQISTFYKDAHSIFDSFSLKNCLEDSVICLARLTIFRMNISIQNTFNIKLKHSFIANLYQNHITLSKKNY